MNILDFQKWFLPKFQDMMGLISIELGRFYNRIFFPIGGSRPIESPAQRLSGYSQQFRCDGDVAGRSPHGLGDLQFFCLLQGGHRFRERDRSGIVGVVQSRLRFVSFFLNVGFEVLERHDFVFVPTDGINNHRF